MKKYLRNMIIAASFAGMGFSMPGCPGQQVQQQLDAIQTSNVELEKKVKALQTQVNGFSNDINQIKQLLPQMTNVIQAQKGALDQLDATVQQMKKGKAGGKKR